MLIATLLAITHAAKNDEALDDEPGPTSPAAAGLSETFVLLRGRWTAGGHVTEPQEDSIVVVPPETLHGFRNIGDVPLLVVSVHESGTLDQTFTDREPA